MHYGVDGTGLWPQLLRTGSRFYLDTGGSELIADGRVALAPGGIRRIKEASVVLTDGRELPADVIVYATGYSPASDLVAKVVGKDVAARVGPFWGYGSGTPGDSGPWEGELRNLYKPMRQEGLWYHTHALGASRLYSLPLALQLKARFEGLATPVYGMAGKGQRAELDSEP